MCHEHKLMGCESSCLCFFYYKREAELFNVRQVNPSRSCRYCQLCLILSDRMLYKELGEMYEDFRSLFTSKSVRNYRMMCLISPQDSMFVVALLLSMLLSM